MRLVNETQSTVVAERLERALRLGARMKGLLGRDALPPGDAMEIRPCTSIHTFFMRFPIDVAFVDERGVVLRAIADLKPWRLTRVYPRAAAVYELPAGALAASGTAAGHVLAAR